MNRAAHVYIHDRNATRFENDCGVAKFRRFFAEKLDGQRCVGGAGFDELVGAPVFFDQGSGVDEVSGAQAEIADFANGEAKR